MQFAPSRIGRRLLGPLVAAAGLAYLEGQGYCQVELWLRWHKALCCSAGPPLICLHSLGAMTSWGSFGPMLETLRSFSAISSISESSTSSIGVSVIRSVVTKVCVPHFRSGDTCRRSGIVPERRPGVGCSGAMPVVRAR